MTPLDPKALKDAGDVCKKCRAPILWATTPKGKTMPIDAEPVFGGNIVIAVDYVGMLRCEVVRPAGDVEAYVAHFTSCPAAEFFRKKEPESAPAESHDEQLAAKRAALQRTMPFGKYVGQSLEEIDRDGRGSSYLKWAYRNLTFREPALKQAIGIVTGLEEP